MDPAHVDAEVAALVAAQRVKEAAEVAEKKGDARTASELFERACEFESAARTALVAGDADRAVSLAVVARKDDLAARALQTLATREPARLASLAAKLELRGDYAWAARAHEERSAAREAAADWERAGDAVHAATLYERAGDPVAAAKALETALRRDPAHAPANIALGNLLVRYGKYEAAVRALQHVRRDSPARRDALAPLVRALGALGLAEAADEAARELAALGGPAEVSPAPAPATDVQRRIYGRYEVVREVASTATSRVLECIDSVRGERVAVKIFASWDSRGTGRDALARFEREVRVLGALDHPNVVPLRDFIPDGPAMVLAWMSGGTLETMMQSPLAPARAVEIAEAVLRALGEAHRLGVLHRDVKPANVLFDDAGVARLSDFGVAHLSDLSVTATAAVIGTLAYMSPEQREGKPATVQSDLYGVGAILFEMLTGERLAIGEEPVAGSAEGGTAQIPKTRPSGVHRDLDARHDAVVMSLLAPSPLERPADTFAARRALSALAWPKDVEHAAIKPRATSPAAERPSAARLQEVDGSAEGGTAQTANATDSWTGRHVERVALTPLSLARAGAFARAGHRAVQLVLRVDRHEETIWLETPAGKSLDRPLTAREHESLLLALDALHAQGVVHGHVDRAHVALDAQLGPLLLFDAQPDPTATADTDFAQLRRLS
ncbi:MAG TPA: protein kinase [Polyangiaceae bacterium]|jgi:serine/threonine-protein kinase